MAKRPADRYASMQELAEALTGYLRATGQAAPAPTAVAARPAAPVARAADRRGPDSLAAALFADLDAETPPPARSKRRARPLWPWLAAGVVVAAAAVGGIVLLARSLSRTAAPQAKEHEPPTPGPKGTTQKPGVVPPKPGVTPAVTAPLKEVENSVGMKLVLIPAGKFKMGSPADEDGYFRDQGPVHDVEITRPFFLGAHEVTQGQYEKVMGANPSSFAATGNDKASRDRVIGLDTSTFPVDSVSWHDAVAFCAKLTALPEEKAAGRAYRLPTEAEWEYACRAGSSTPFHSGDSLSSKQANFNGNFPSGGGDRGPYLQRTCPVGSYAANVFGLHDMHGNVWEWVADRYGEDYYASSERRDPQGPESGDRRILRGGSWDNRGKGCRTAFRRGHGPANRLSSYGFRVVCVAPPGPGVPTPAPSDDGFQPLFNGRDLDGWSLLNFSHTKNKARNTWAADPERKVLFSRGGDFQDLQSERRFKDFTLKLDWRFTPGGAIGPNGSGIVVRSRELDSFGRNPRGIEIDLRSKENWNEKRGWGTGLFIAYETVLRSHWGKTDGKKVRQLGWLREPPLRPEGEWNTCEVRCAGDRIKVWMNGALVNEGWGAEEVAGRVCLRSQNTAVEFRDVRIKELAPAADQGFVALFNGKDLTGWVNVNTGPGTFFARDGEIVTTGAPYGFLRTDTQYENFVLELDWMHVEKEKRANSGLFIWCDPLPAAGKRFPRGFEVQVLVNVELRDKKTRAVTATSHGDIFSSYGARCTPDRPHPLGWERCLPSENRARGGGEWNHYKVIANDGVIKLHVNGKEVSGVSNCAPRKGYIALQSEGAQCHFKNIRIKELPPTAGQGFVPLFNGKDLTGWEGLSGAWRAHQGALYGKLPAKRKRHTFLCSTKKYRDFELKFQVKLKNGKGNSGVQIRSTVIDPKGYIVAGPQVEIDARFGGLYGELSGGWMQRAPDAVVERVFKRNDFNDYLVRVVGKHVTVTVNGEQLVDGDFDTMADEGIIALQLHGGGPKGNMKSEELVFKDVMIKELPGR
jgi:formylglycine-generating enzyme required for sulfatase activity